MVFLGGRVGVDGACLSVVFLDVFFFFNADDLFMEYDLHFLYI